MDSPDRWSKIVNNLQVDITSHCNARCGACVRNSDGDEVREELELEHFDVDVWRRLVTEDTRGWYIAEMSLNGNWGDPMMHPKLVEMLDIFSSHHPETSLFLHTNGSMRTEKFWHDLGGVCRKFSNHLVVFAVDGMEDTHALYRRKTIWSKIIANIGAFTSNGGRANCMMTLFEHNKHQVHDVERIAGELNCIYFTLRHSHCDEMQIDAAEGAYSVKASYDIDEFQTAFEPDISLSDLRDNHLFVDLSDEVKEREQHTKCPWYNERRVQIDPWAKVWPCCHLSLYGVHIDNHDLHEEADESFVYAREDNDLKKYSLTDVLENDWYRKKLPNAIDGAKWNQCRRICGVEA